MAENVILETYVESLLTGHVQENTRYMYIR